MGREEDSASGELGGGGGASAWHRMVGVVCMACGEEGVWHA